MHRAPRDLVSEVGSGGREDLKCGLKGIKWGAMVNGSGGGQFAAGRPEGSSRAAKTERWDRQSVDWLGGVRVGNLARAVKQMRKWGRFDDWLMAVIVYECFMKKVGGRDLGWQALI